MNSILNKILRRHKKSTEFRESIYTIRFLCAIFLSLDQAVSLTLFSPGWSNIIIFLYDQFNPRANQLTPCAISDCRSCAQSCAQNIQKRYILLNWWINFIFIFQKSQLSDGLCADISHSINSTVFIFAILCSQWLSQLPLIPHIWKYSETIKLFI